MTEIEYQDDPDLYVKWPNGIYQLTNCDNSIGEEFPGCEDGHVRCDGKVFFSEPSPFGCGMPCNYGDWDYASMTISYPLCGTGCEYTIFYRYRTSIGCNPEFYDYDLLWIGNFNESCNYFCYRFGMTIFTKNH